jgi:hypothetical protein
MLEAPTFVAGLDDVAVVEDPTIELTVFAPRCSTLLRPSLPVIGRRDVGHSFDRDGQLHDGHLELAPGPVEGGSDPAQSRRSVRYRDKADKSHEVSHPEHMSRFSGYPSNQVLETEQFANRPRAHLRYCYD